jgi:hypothetical protein
MDDLMLKITVIFVILRDTPRSTLRRLFQLLSTIMQVPHSHLIRVMVSLDKLRMFSGDRVTEESPFMTKSLFWWTKECIEQEKNTKTVKPQHEYKHNNPNPILGVIY